MAEERITVAARSRPGCGENEKEWVKNGRNIMKKDGTEIYTFDYVFDEFCTNEVIYKKVMAGLVGATLSGFNTAVCTYGQSGAGKTHTLTGSQNEDGLVQYTFRALLQTIAKASDREYTMRISYIEICHEKVRDLLSQSSMDLPIYENEDGANRIDGLTEQVVTENAQVAELLEKAQDRRKLGETSLNERSSCSHTIIRLTIESHDMNHGSNGIRCSVMNLVDLAGSEHAAAAGTNGLRQKEGANINRSLFAFKKVLFNLADNQKYISYRDPKLTRVLKPSLEGNSKIAIICCIAPFSMTETTSTLKFAKLAKRIVTRPVVNEVSGDGVPAGNLREIAELKETEVQTTEPYPPDQSDEVPNLKKENEVLRRKLDDEKKHCLELQKKVVDAEAKIKDLMERNENENAAMESGASALTCKFCGKETLGPARITHVRDRTYIRRSCLSCHRRFTYPY